MERAEKEMKARLLGLGEEELIPGLSNRGRNQRLQRSNSFSRLTEALKAEKACTKQTHPVKLPGARGSDETKKTGMRALSRAVSMPATPTVILNDDKAFKTAASLSSLMQTFEAEQMWKEDSDARAALECELADEKSVCEASDTEKRVCIERDSSDELVDSHVEECKELERIAEESEKRRLEGAGYVEDARVSTFSGAATSSDSVTDISSLCGNGTISRTDSCGDGLEWEEPACGQPWGPKFFVTKLEYTTSKNVYQPQLDQPDSTENHLYDGWAQAVSFVEKLLEFEGLEEQTADESGAPFPSFFLPCNETKLANVVDTLQGEKESRLSPSNYDSWQPAAEAPGHYSVFLSDTNLFGEILPENRFS